LKTKKNIENILCYADRIIVNNIDGIQIPAERETVEIRELTVPYRSYDIYNRVKEYLKTVHPNVWVNRSKAIKSVMKEDEKYETMCFRWYDIPTSKFETMDVNIIYTRKVKHVLYVKVHV
jgi:hypothetical protein